jgi:hypothetical protein
VAKPHLSKKLAITAIPSGGIKRKQKKKSNPAEKWGWQWLAGAT